MYYLKHIMDKGIFLCYKEHIDKIIPISQEIWDDLKAILRTRELKKNEFIVKEHQKFNLEIFVHKGVIRGFYGSSSGDEINVSFYQDNELVCPYFARIMNGKSNINLQAITPTIIFEIEQDTMKAIRHKYLELIKYSSLVVENELERKTQHEILLLVKDAEERYRIFQTMFPHLEQRISQYHIASYLRITPVSLSRLRKNLSKK
jgi:CRP-like cAMP-binding protein